LSTLGFSAAVPARHWSNPPQVQPPKRRQLLHLQHRRYV